MEKESVITQGEPVSSMSDPKRAAMKRVIGFAVGILLIAAAVWAVLSGQTAIHEFRDHVVGAPLHLKLLTVALPVLNWVLISISFWLLSRRYGIVRIGEMHTLIGSAWLLNYLPLRPGMLGRFAYHKTIHSIRVADSIRITIMSVALTAVATATLLALSLIAMNLPLVVAWGLLALPTALLACIGGAISLRTGSAFTAAASITLAAAVRFCDILTWVARYAVVFALIGHPLTLPQAALVTAVSQIAMMIPLAGNGLGLREWGIGLTIPLAAGGTASIGLTADLLNRAAEILVALPVGLISAAFLLHAHRKRNRTWDQLQSEPDPADPTVRIDP